MVAILLLWKLHAFGGTPPTVRRPEVIQVALTPQSEAPPFFSELPKDRADEAPKKPDFLSNVTSRARDRVPGGDSNLPRMEGHGEDPTVKLAAGKSQASSPQASQPQPTAPAGVRAAAPQASSQKPGATSLLPVPDAAILHGAAGGSALDQPEMSHPTGNATALGDVSLNTIAWDYAPWLERFGSQLMERWYAPPAYTMGILKEGGWGLFEVEISKSGKLLRMEQLDEQGHPSLPRAAGIALRSMAPIEPLPADFPEPTLILRIRMIYPAWAR